MNSDTIVVDVQGFKDLYNNFIVKELALATCDSTQTFLIKPPYRFQYLTSDEKKQVKWVERNRGIYWNEGYIDYREFRRIIVPYLESKKIVVKGLEKVKWINDLGMKNCNIIELDENQCPNLSVLHKKYCNGRSNLNCIMHSNQCALKNVICLRKYLEN